MSEGKWIKDTSEKYKSLGLVTYRCSCCRNIVVVTQESFLESISEYKYCFNCGAKMEVEE